jgi:hypothetical protein
MYDVRAAAQSRGAHGQVHNAEGLNRKQAALNLVHPPANYTVRTAWSTRQISIRRKGKRQVGLTTYLRPQCPYKQRPQGEGE